MAEEKQNLVSIIIDESQVFYCIGFYTFFLHKVHSTYFKCRDIYFIVLKLNVSLEHWPLNYGFHKG